MDGGAPQPSITARLFALPKGGSTQAEYEDAWAINQAGGRYALADGASESAFAAAWAQALAARWAASPPAGDDVGAWRAWLRPAQAAWATAVQAEPLPWYVAAKVRQGAFATLIGLTVQAGTWAAVGVGDSCLFHVAAPAAEGEAVVAGFPLADPAAFGAHPPALCSVPAPNEAVWPHLALAEGTWQPGDSFVLATDALAQWLLRAVPPQHWPRFVRYVLAADDAAFARLVADQRACGALRDDDVTLLIISTAEGRDGS